MSDSENDGKPDFDKYLPVPVGARTPRPSLVRSSPEASFVSQLIAARENVPQQREKRRAPAEQAVNAYGASAASTVRRMPKGYNKTVVA